MKVDLNKCIEDAKKSLDVMLAKESKSSADMFEITQQLDLITRLEYYNKNESEDIFSGGEPGSFVITEEYKS